MTLTRITHHICETIKLRPKLSFRLMVSGVLEISKNDVTASLDLGDRSCDATGSMTYPNRDVERLLTERFNRQ